MDSKGSWAKRPEVKFFWAKTLGFWPKNLFFLLLDPKFCQWPVYSPWKDGPFAPWDYFFDFSFPINGRFRKKTGLTRQKVFPLPTVGAHSASKSPCNLSARAG